MKRLLNWIRRTLDHDLSLGYVRQLRWLCMLFLIVFVLIIATLFVIVVVDKDFDMGNVNLPGTAFLLLTDPGNLSGVLPNNHSWIIGIIYALIAIVGAFVFSGLLISLISNSVQRRVEKIEGGNVYYQLHDHIVVIGYDTILPSLVKQIVNKQEWQSKDVLILTKKSPAEVREALNPVVDVKSKQLIIYSGQRSSELDLRNLQTENAHEIFIIGNRQSDDHDALNIDCLSKLVSIIQEYNPQKHPTINILLENPATQTMLQSTNLADNWQKMVNVIPFSFYENWARRVLSGQQYPRLLVDTNTDQQLNIVIFGMSKMGVTIAVEAAHALHFPRKKDGSVRKTIITFISLNAYEEMTLFRTRYRQIFEIQSSRFFDLIDDNKKDKDIPVITEIPPTYFTGKDADFLDVEFEFVRGNAFSDGVQRLLCDRIEKEHRKMALFACTGKDTTDMNIALYLPEQILRQTEIYIRQHHSGQLLDWLRLKSKEEQGLYANIYPFGMEDTVFDLNHDNQRMGMLINYFYNFHNYYPLIFEVDHILTVDERQNVQKYWNEGTSVADQWSSSYCCMSFAQKLAQWGIDIEKASIDDIKNVINDNIEVLGYIEHNRWNMEKLLFGFRKPHADEQAEIDESRKVLSDNDKQCKHKYYKKKHIHSYLNSFDALADVNWIGMNREKDDVRKIDYDMLQQIPWILKNSKCYEEKLYS